LKRPALILAALLLSAAAVAVDTGQRFEDPAQQARYERLIRDLRCLVCRSESIADSNAMLAADLRREVESLMRAGKTDGEIHAFMTERYGDFVLLRPPVAPRTWLLWAAPAVFVLAGLVLVALVIRRRSDTARRDPAALDEEPDGP
jgi:cytochrome c-type biogenesis protein CcmH